jgi:hypothetical protein
MHACMMLTYPKLTLVTLTCMYYSINCMRPYNY